MLTSSIELVPYYLILFAENMIDVLVEHAEAFLEQFSISRITMGEIVSFINLLELDNTKTKLAQTLKTIKVRDLL